MSSATPLKDADVDHLVLQYLRKRKFKEAERVLQLEIKEAAGSGGGADAMALQQLLDSDEGVIENLLFSTAAEGEPAAYVQGYDKLAAWVDSSLDLYRHELSRLLYPVLVHAYLNLVSLGATAEAQQLLAAHKQRFIDAAGEPSKLRMQELHDLQSVAVPEHLQTNRSAQALRALKYPVRLSAYAYQLLTRFLQQGGPRMLLVLALVNEHLKLEVVEGPPSAVDDASLLGEEDAVAGVVQHEALATNQKPLDLQLLRGNLEDKFEERQAEKQEQDAQRAAEQGEEQKATKKQKAAQQKAVQEAKERREAVGADRMEPEIPLPEVAEQWEEHLLREIASRADVSPAAPPSAAFYTFVNTHQALNCVAFTSDAACVAGGFADSSVRIYDLAARAASGAGASTSRQPVTHYWGHSGPVYGLDYSPDNQLLFSGSGDGTVRLWSMEVRANLVAYRGHVLPVWGVASCPHQQGFYFASCGADRTARVWNTERAQPLRIMIGHQSDVDVVRWHPNCHYIATGSADRTVRLWDVRTGDCCRVFVGHRAAITSMAFSPDGATLATGDADGAVLVWDLAAAKRAATLAQHTDRVWALAYSEGAGSILASGAADCTVQLWDAKGPAQQPAAVAAGTAGGGGGAGAGGAAAAKPGDGLAHLKTFKTKATPVFGLRFTTRNLLLGSGALTLYRPPKLRG